MKLGHFVNGRGRFFLVAAPLLLGVIAFAATRAYSYTQSPSFCSVCHTMKPAFELWETGEHREVDCHSCHEESFGESVVKLVTYAVLHPDHVEARAEVLPERCAGCHGSSATTTTTASAEALPVTMPPSRLHQLHARELEVKCLACHGMSLHRFQPLAQREYCLACHTDRQQHSAPAACTSCHSFGLQTRAGRQDGLGTQASPLRAQPEGSGPP